MVTRREFLDTLAVGAAGLAIGSTAKSYGQIMGSNDRLNFAVIGLNGRAYAHLSALKANKNCCADCLCLRCGQQYSARNLPAATEKEMGEAPETEKDFRHILQTEGRGCDHDCDARPLACSDGDCWAAGGQACLCGEAVQP